VIPHDERLPLSRDLPVRADVPTDHRLPLCQLSGDPTDQVTGAATWRRGL
jgi:hypothetical protein